MTPDVLKTINSIVNQELIPQPLSELSDPEGKYKAGEPETKRRSGEFEGVLRRLSNSWKKGMIVSRDRYTHSNKPTSEMPPLSYCAAKTSGERQKVNNQSLPNQQKDGDWIFKDADGSTRLVSNNDLRKDFEGRPTGTLVYRKGKPVEYAKYNGSPTEFSSGSETKLLKPGDYLIRLNGKGGGYTRMSEEEKNKNIK